jgi:hypothetical protein
VVPPTPAQALGAVERPAARLEVTGWTRLQYLEWDLVECVRDLDHARATGQIKLAIDAGRRASDVRAALDQARGEAGRAVKLDRNPAAVAAEMARRQQQLAQLAAAPGATKDRDL